MIIKGINANGKSITKYRFLMPAIKSILVRIGRRVRDVPRSGWMTMKVKGIIVIKEEIIMKLNLLEFSMLELMNFANAKMMVIFANSEGCNAKGPTAIHLWAPWLTFPITKTAIKEANEAKKERRQGAREVFKDSVKEFIVNMTASKKECRQIEKDNSSSSSE